MNSTAFFTSGVKQWLVVPHDPNRRRSQNQGLRRGEGASRLPKPKALTHGRLYATFSAATVCPKQHVAQVCVPHGGDMNALQRCAIGLAGRRDPGRQGHGRRFCLDRCSGHLPPRLALLLSRAFMAITAISTTASSASLEATAQLWS